ncbi:MAG: type IV toxin-antitoxin system AbiEi family antitoxin domain-containing protein [Desertimonas sp.]
MDQLPEIAEAWIRERHGVVTTAELARFGVRRSALGRFERVGLLRRVERGVFVLAGSPATLAQRCAVQCRAHPRGFITGPTAGALAGLRRMPTATAVHVAVRHGRHLPAVDGVRYRQTTALIQADRRHRPDGLVTASWARLAFDLAADLRLNDHRSVVHQLLDRGLVTTPQLRAIAGRLCHPARRGSTTFARTMASLDDGGPHQSHAEVRVADALRAAGVPVIPQAAVAIVGGRTLHVDLGVPELRWGVELDVHPEHRSIEGAANDAERRSLAMAAGWTIETAAELDVAAASLPGLIRRLASSYQRALALHRSVG